MWRVLAVYLGVYVHVDGFLRYLRKQAVRHTEGEYASRGWSQVYVVAVSRYRVKEAERTWKHSLNFNTRQRNAFWKGDFFRNWGKPDDRNEKRLRFLLLHFFSFTRVLFFFFRLFFFSLIRSKRKEGHRVSGMGMPLFDFLFSFFFTCFSNARWKMPRRMRVGVEYPFLWFWQLLAFVSAMEIVLGVLCYYLRASFLYSARESLSYCWLCVHVCCVRLCLFVDKSDLHVTMSSCSEWAKINSPFCNHIFIFWVSKNWPSVCNHIFISAVYF